MQSTENNFKYVNKLNLFTIILAIIGFFAFLYTL